MGAEQATAKLFAFAQSALAERLTFPEALEKMLALPIAAEAEEGLPLMLLRKVYRQAQEEPCKEIHCPEWAQQNGRGKIEPSVAHLMAALRRDPRLAGTLHFNTFADRVEVAALSPAFTLEATEGSMLTDGMTTDARAWFGSPLRCGWAMREPSKPVMYEALVRVAETDHAYHPVQRWLEALKWDGHNRLDDLWHLLLSVDQSDYHRAVAWAFLLAMIERVYQPGCKFDYVPLLVGPERIGKSSLCAALAGEHFADTHLDLNSKDAYQAIRGKWLYEISELTGMKRVDQERWKGFLSSAVDTYRSPYGLLTYDRPRQCCFIGTTNDEEWLTASGGFRFWPLVCRYRIDHEWVREWRPQIFAQAFAAYQKGVRWPQFMEALSVEHGERLEAHRFTDAREERLVDWMQVLNGRPFTLLEAHEDCFKHKGPPERGEQMQYGRWLREHGAVKRRCVVNGVQSWRWWASQGAFEAWGPRPIEEVPLPSQSIWKVGDDR